MMKNLYNYILLAVMAFATVGCLGELNTDIPSAESGDEVQFGLSLPSMTRTTYGDKNAAGTAYPIYWVDGDKVQVYSPQCLAGRNNAEYKVSVNSATQNYATSLTPTGANGVQWGDEPAMFYSVYPSGDYTILNDGATIQNLKINFTNDFEVLENGVVTPKGADCLMFAKTAGSLDPGSTVNLNYSPLATSLMITLRGPSDQSIVSEHTIQSIKLIAPENTFIAGSFNVELQKITEVEKYVHTGWSDGAPKSNSITAQVYDKSTGAFHTIREGDVLKIAMFLAPLTALTIDGEWKIEILVRSNVPQEDPNGNVTIVETMKTFTKSLAFENGFNGTLKPGMVHELPALPTLDITAAPEQEWKVEDWMENIPRNVYLSEVSIPGSWNSLNVDSQGTSPTIASQYALGIRAFHLDTRWKRTQTGGSTWNPTYTYELGTAIGGSGNTANGSNGKYMTAGATFEQNLIEVIGNVKEDEYMVLICSFAPDSQNHQSSNGYWYDEISAICNKYDQVFDTRNLTLDTVIGEVLNRVIVIVNLDGAINTNSTLPKNSKCLFVSLPTDQTSSLYDDDMTDNHSLLWTSKDIVSSTGINMYYTQAQASVQGNSYTGEERYDSDRGGYLPLYGERVGVASRILEWSRTNYSNEGYSHDSWIYLGLGGYYVEWSDGFFGIGAGWNEISNPNETLAKDFNEWIDGEVTKMGTKTADQSTVIPYYPVGIVMMNRVSNYAATVKKILLLNNKYRMQYDPDKPADYKPALTSAAASYSSGMHDQNVAAFGWD